MWLVLPPGPKHLPPTVKRSPPKSPSIINPASQSPPAFPPSTRSSQETGDSTGCRPYLTHPGHHRRQQNLRAFAPALGRTHSPQYLSIQPLRHRRRDQYLRPTRQHSTTHDRPPRAFTRRNHSALPLRRDRDAESRRLDGAAPRSRHRQPGIRRISSQQRRGHRYPLRENGANNCAALRGHGR